MEEAGDTRTLCRATRGRSGLRHQALACIEASASDAGAFARVSECARACGVNHCLYGPKERHRARGPVREDRRWPTDSISEDLLAIGAGQVDRVATPRGQQMAVAQQAGPQRWRRQNPVGSC